jgi:hypothetical protein
MSLPLTSPGGVDYWEETRRGEPETAKGTFSPTGFRGVRVFRCAWTDYKSLAGELLGGPAIGTWTEGEQFPGIDGSVCMSVDFEGFGKSGRDSTDDSAIYDWAILTAHYDTPIYSKIFIDSTVPIYASEKAKFASEFITYGTNAMFWQVSSLASGDDEPLGDKIPQGRLIGSAEYELKIWHVISPKWNDYRLADGHVNDFGFSPLLDGTGKGYYWPDGELLMIGFEDESTFWYNGFKMQQVWNITLKFKWRQERWNTALRPAYGWFEDFNLKNGDQVFQGYNFYNLL